MDETGGGSRLVKVKVDRGGRDGTPRIPLEGERLSRIDSRG